MLWYKACQKHTHKTVIYSCKFGVALYEQHSVYVTKSTKNFGKLDYAYHWLIAQKTRKEIRWGSTEINPSFREVEYNTEMYTLYTKIIAEVGPQQGSVIFISE